MSVLTLMPTDSDLDVHVEQVEDLAGGTAAAVFDSLRREYRYLLTRVWHPSLPTAVFLMLNPSTAGADADDPTVRRIAGPNGFARKFGAGGVVIVNLFALCSPDPARLRTHRDPVGFYNSVFVRQAVRQADLAHEALEVGADRDREPLRSVRPLHEIAIAPIVLGELHVVVEDEHVDVVDQVEVTLPRDVVRLVDRDLHRSRLNSSTMSA